MSGRRRRYDDGRGPAEGFVQRVLRATSGAPCRRAASLLPDLVDGELADMDRRLVQAHLEHCAECRALAVTLSWALPLLPRLAVVRPDADFTAGVLERTSRTPRRRAVTEPSAPVQAGSDQTGTAPGGVPRQPIRRPADRPSGRLSWARLRRWWRRQILRPGFAVEAAYTVAVVLVLLTAVPNAPLRGTPGRALQAVNAGFGSWVVLDQAVDTGLRWTTDQARRGVAAGRQQAVQVLRPVAGAWHDRAGRTEAGRTEVARHLRAVVSYATEGRLQEAAYASKQSADALREVWRLWWSDDLSTEGESHE